MAATDPHNPNDPTTQRPASGAQPVGETTQAPPQLIPTQGIGTPGTPTASMSAAPVTPAPVVAGVTNQETASGQLKTLLDEQSPLLIGARTRAQQQATARGLQNSTMAAQSGEKALIDSALPIAQFDATAHFNRTNTNLDSINRFGLNEQGIQGQLRVGEQSIQGQKDLSAQQAEQQSRLMSQETESRVRLLSQEGAQRLQEIGAQTDASARLQQMDQDFRMLQQQFAAGHDITLEDRRFQNQMATMIAEYGQRTSLSQVEQSQQLERMNLQHAQTLEQIAAQAAAAQQAEVGPRLQSQYLAAVSDRMNAGSNEIAQIYSTQGLSASQQQTAVQNAHNRMTNDLASIAAYYRQSPNWDPAWGQNTQAPPSQPSTGTPPTYFPGGTVTLPGGAQVPIPPGSAVQRPVSDVTQVLIPTKSGMRPVGASRTGNPVVLNQY